MRRLVKISIMCILAIVIFVSISGCVGHQKSKNAIVKDFKDNIDSFETVAKYICNYDLSKYKNLPDINVPVYVDFAVSDFQAMHKEVMMVSAGYMPVLFSEEIYPDKITIENVKKIFDLGYAYIGKVGIDSDTPIVIYFRINDIEDPKSDRPHGIAYTSDNLPPNIDNGDRIPSYTERLMDNWYYYEKDALNVAVD